MMVSLEKVMMTLQIKHQTRGRTRKKKRRKMKGKKLIFCCGF